MTAIRNNTTQREKIGPILLRGWDGGTAQDSLRVISQSAAVAADMLLCCRTGSTQKTIRGSFIGTVETDSTPIPCIDASLTRITAVKDRWPAPTSLSH